MTNYEKLIALIGTNLAELKAAFTAAKGQFPNQTVQSLIGNYVQQSEGIVKQFAPKTAKEKPAPKVIEQPEEQPEETEQPEEEGSTLVGMSKKNTLENEGSSELSKASEEDTRTPEQFLESKPTKKVFIEFARSKDMPHAEIEELWKNRNDANGNN